MPVHIVLLQLLSGSRTSNRGKWRRQHARTTSRDRFLFLLSRIVTFHLLHRRRRRRRHRRCPSVRRPMAPPPSSPESQETGDRAVCGGWGLAAFFTSRDAPPPLPPPPPPSKKTMPSSVCNCLCVTESVNIHPSHRLSVHNNRGRRFLNPAGRGHRLY